MTVHGMMREGPVPGKQVPPLQDCRVSVEAGDTPESKAAGEQEN
jgi:hypothetical protein